MMRNPLGNTTRLKCEREPFRRPPHSKEYRSVVGNSKLLPTTLSPWGMLIFFTMWRSTEWRIIHI